MQSSPFRLTTNTPLKFIERLAEKVTGLHKLDAFYQQRPSNLDCQSFLRYTLDVLGISYHLTAGSAQNIPQTGAVVVVANHPLGAVEGVILAEVLRQVRPDVKILANQYLKRLPELSELFIAVDVFEGEGALKANIKAMREAQKHLEHEGLLLIFPAGEVSSYDQHGQLNDVAWSKSAARLIKRTQADALTIHIDGKNSRSFYLAGKVHPLLRTAMLGRELLNKQTAAIGISIGEVIEHKELCSLKTDQEITDYLRLNTYLLAPHPDYSPKALEYQTQIIDPIPSEFLTSEINALAIEDHLLDFKEFSVYCTKAKHIPNLLKEIGRIRETNFRLVNEGTGKACDLDEFDQTYLHLFVWDRQNQALVGAYRLGLSDKIIAKKGVKGLYSRTLFEYDASFIQDTGKAIEMGRSMIDAPYQKSLTALLLLWKGIAAYASRHPDYTHLFGPVSISSEYSPVARQLMVSTLQMHYFDQDKATQVKASNPLQTNIPLWRQDMLSALADIQLLSKVLVRLNQQSVPVLLKQYLNLNGKLVSFNVDEDFNDALDGLIFVDLREVPTRTLAKYMGKDDANAYLTYHQA